VIGGKEVEISASIGISAGGDESDDLLRNADLAMYRAKGRGKGRYELFEPQMHAAVIERLELEVDMRRAIEREQFELHYQPIVSLASERIVGIEALVRWRHPQRGLVQPENFIQLAEETRLIVPIGRWVLREACRRAAEWRGEGSGLSVCVNLSAEQLQHAGIADEVADALALSGLDARSLVLEITETVLMQDTEATIEKLEEIKRLGVRLAVDDFGTGYSSLQYLKRFPIDILKIAKSFVDGLGGARDDAALARAIVDVANSFQMQVVAEGIENAPQAARLLELGCPLGQGFHFARPMEAAAIAERLSAPDGLETWPVAPTAAPAPAASRS
jgi:EAL domain-containing protein (putative c-di-GMP-specific phosphodiesterase class I)